MTTSAPTTPSPRSGGTVVVCLALSDGLVMAADSRLTNVYPEGIEPRYKIISDAASKLFSVGRVGIAAYDEAFILNRTIGSIIADFDNSDHLDKNDVEAVADRFVAYFGKLYGQQVEIKKTQPNIGFVVAGYDKNGIGKFIEITYPKPGKPTISPNTTRSAGMFWKGQTDVITRLILGFDPSIGNIPEFSNLDEAGRDKIIHHLEPLEYNIPYDRLMLQDGIDLSLSLVQTTVDMQRFAFGLKGSVGAVPGVGGNVDVMVIDPYQLLWVKRKALGAK